MTTRWKLTIEYNGAEFSGWQRQDHAPSVQQAVEDAITAFSGQKAALTAAGRTDAGVHARGQVAHIDLEDFVKPMQGFEVAKAINAHLRPQRVSVVSAQKAAPDFHARFGAKNKVYRYRIINRGAPLGLDHGLAWHVKRPLDVSAMQDAARHLIGHHDFTTFRDSQCQAKTPMRTLSRLDITAAPCDPCGGVEIMVEAQAQSFLHHQVRNMVGTLALVGEGKWKPAAVKDALEAKDRTRGGPTAPADGLYLMLVDY